MIYFSLDTCLPLEFDLHLNLHMNSIPLNKYFTTIAYLQFYIYVIILSTVHQ